VFTSSKLFLPFTIYHLLRLGRLNDNFVDLYFSNWVIFVAAPTGSYHSNSMLPYCSTLLISAGTIFLLGEQKLNDFSAGEAKIGEK